MLWGTYANTFLKFLISIPRSKPADQPYEGSYSTEQTWSFVYGLFVLGYSPYACMRALQSLQPDSAQVPFV